jgi:hypothetical protein
MRNERALSAYDNDTRHFWVDGIYGNNGASGNAPNQPFLTMARAFARLKSGDTIHFRGNVSEQLVTPSGVFDVTIIGEGNRPRHADAHTSSNLSSRGGRSSATWKAPSSPVSGQALLRIVQQGWRLENILFSGFTTGTPASVELVRNDGAGDLERDASHAHIIGCRFAGGSKGIRFGATSYTENNFNVEIERCDFSDCVIAIGGAQCYRAYIHNNRFALNTNHIILACTESVISDNIFSNHTTKSVDLTSGGGKNIVTKNYLSGLYTTAAYIASNANDEWAGNFNTLTGGITVADPAA